MATLQARCPNCRDTVRVAPADAALLWPESEGLGHVLFTCPACQVLVKMPVNRGLADLLRRHGTHVNDTAASLVVPSRRPDPTAPPFTLDDLLDLHELLERDDWFEQLLVAG